MVTFILNFMIVLNQCRIAITIQSSQLIFHDTRDIKAERDRACMLSANTNAGAKALICVKFEHSIWQSGENLARIMHAEVHYYACIREHGVARRTAEYYCRFGSTYDFHDLP